MARVLALACLALLLVVQVNGAVGFEFIRPGFNTQPPCNFFIRAMETTGVKCTMEELCPGDDEDCISAQTRHRRAVGGTGSGMSSGSGEAGAESGDGGSGDGGSGVGSGSGSGDAGSGDSEESSGGGGRDNGIQCADEHQNIRTVTCTPRSVPSFATDNPATTTPFSTSTKPGPVPTTKTVVVVDTTKPQPPAPSTLAPKTTDAVTTAAERTPPQPTATVRPDPSSGGPNDKVKEDDDDEEDGGSNDQLVTIVGIGVGAFVGCVVLAVFATIIVLRYKQTQDSHYMVDAEVDSQRSGSSGSNSSTSSTTPLQKKSHFV